MVTAFLGGVLALLSPCGALLLPAFFASTVGTGPRLWTHAAVFYVGLVAVLVPLHVAVVALRRHKALLHGRLPFRSGEQPAPSGT